MEQYIYANVKREAYKMVSSSPDFFGNVRNATLMRHLINHDNHCPHGELKPWEHQSFWMVTTDMDRPGEVPRLFLQASGGDDHRDGIYVHGYMCEVPKSQSDIYENQLSHILSLDFLDKEGALKTAEALTLPQCSLENAKSVSQLSEMVLDPKVMKAVLLYLLSRKKVIIRIPSTGKEAMHDSRSLLLAIYNRLPYDYRASTGFVTGCALSALSNTQNPLPGAINLVILDADADISGFRARPSMVLIDLKQPMENFPEMERISPVCSQMLAFLSEGETEDRKQFFEFSKRLKEILKPAQRMELSDYLPVFQMYSTIHHQLTEDSVKYMAVIPFTTPNWNTRINEFYSKMLAERIDSRQMQRYFDNQIGSISAISSFGEVDKAEYERIRLDKTGSVEVQDQNFGLVMHMLEMAIPYYSDSKGERERFVTDLTETFRKRAESDLAWISDTAPTKHTLEQMNQLRLPALSEGDTVSLDVKKNVSRFLSTKKQEIKELYENNLMTQYREGERKIEAWPCSADCRLEDLYHSLRSSYYLYDELVDGDAHCWNQQIIRKIQKYFNEKNPETAEAFTAMQDEISYILQFYSREFPTAAHVLEKDLSGRQIWCQKALEFLQKSCSGLTDYLESMNSLINLKYSRTFCQELLKKWLTQISALDIAWAEVRTLISRICALAANGDYREFLRNALSGCRDMLILPESLKAEEAIQKLRELETLEKANVLPGRIYSEHLKTEGTAEQLRLEFQHLQEAKRKKHSLFTSGGSKNRNQPDYDVWNSAENGGSQSKAQGAANQWGRSQGSYSGSFAPGTDPFAAEKNAVFSGKKLVSPVLPGVPQLESLNRIQNRSGVIAAGSIMTGAAGVVPAAALFLLGAGLVPTAVTAGMMAAMAGTLEITSFAVHGRTRKKLMRFMGLSMLPGILGSTAAVLLQYL